MVCAVHLASRVPIQKTAFLLLREAKNKIEKDTGNNKLGKDIVNKIKKDIGNNNIKKDIGNIKKDIDNIKKDIGNIKKDISNIKNNIGNNIQANRSYLFTSEDCY